MSYWLKLYTEIIDDPKLADVPEWAKWCFVEFLCLAKENDKDGELQTANKMAWRLRKTVKQVETALRTLEQSGVVHTTGAVWFVTNFAKRQALSESADRVRRFREKKKEEEKRNTPVTVTGYGNVSPSSSISSSSLNSDSSDFKNVPLSAVAYAAFQDNGGPRKAERLYQLITGQMSIPSLSQAQALTDLQSMLDYYGTNWDRAVAEGREVFGLWCAQHGKNGKAYSPVNTAWLTKWLEKIAPRPDKPDLETVSGQLERARQMLESVHR